MLAVSFNALTGAPTNTPIYGQGMIMQGGRTNTLLWAPAARDLTTFSGVAASTSHEASRTSSTIFLRLLRENIRITTSDSTPWLWRRIVFSSKDTVFKQLQPSETGGAKNAAPYIESSNGYGRLLQQWDTAAGSGNTAAAQQELLFKGKRDVDWSDSITAKVDTRIVNLHYDKTTIIRSGNDTGTYHVTKRVHQFNKTYIYNEDEVGDVMDTSVWTSRGKGHADIFIMDIFQNFLGSASTLLNFTPTATLYWHER